MENWSENAPLWLIFNPNAQIRSMQAAQCGQGMLSLHDLQWIPLKSSPTRPASPRQPREPWQSAVLQQKQCFETAVQQRSGVSLGLPALRMALLECLHV